MTEIETRAAAIAARIADYRTGEIVPPDAVHVLRWARQFDEPVRLPIVREMEHILGNAYWSRQEVTGWLAAQARNKDLAGASPATFWPGVQFLRLQQDGDSQRHMLDLFDGILQKQFGVHAGAGGAAPHTYVYMDDMLYSGGRIRHDLLPWIGSAPAKARLVILLIGVHRSGQWYTKNKLEEAAAGKSISIEWWHSVDVEDRLARINGSDVLRPKSVPTDAATQAYVAALGEPPNLRQGNAIGPLAIYSSATGRDLLEEAFFAGGVQVRRRCPHFDQYMRPLGRMYFAQPGFGTPFVTYRNCPNNAPLVLWAGDPWYPLFPRRNN